jgi:hypothetical protein
MKLPAPDRRRQDRYPLIALDGCGQAPAPLPEPRCLKEGPADDAGAADLVDISGRRVGWRCVSWEPPRQALDVRKQVRFSNEEPAVLGQIPVDYPNDCLQAHPSVRNKPSDLTVVATARNARILDEETKPFQQLGAAVRVSYRGRSTGIAIASTPVGRDFRT